jgi:hypothetical protein
MEVTKFKQTVPSSYTLSIKSIEHRFYLHTTQIDKTSKKIFGKIFIKNFYLYRRVRLYLLTKSNTF